MIIPLFFSLRSLRLCAIFFLFSFNQQTSFKPSQLQFERVKTAYTEKENLVKELFSKQGLDFPKVKIFLRAFKHERDLELWASDSKTDSYKHIATYPFCSLSGELGPKRKQGDGQVPEGFYHIDRFNPASSYYLSLGVNYPNASDKILGTKGALGGDIFIHGKCVTIGCIPITDKKIKELYLIAVEAKSNGQQKIPVHIFPAKMSGDGLEYLSSYRKEDKALHAFWDNLKEGYEYFEKSKTLPLVSVNTNGVYQFK